MWLCWPQWHVSLYVCGPNDAALLSSSMSSQDTGVECEFSLAHLVEALVDALGELDGL